MLHSIIVSLSITFGGQTPNVQLDINPTFLVNAPVSSLTNLPNNAEFWAFTLPHLIVIDEAAIPPAHRARLLREEAAHAKQWTALGPWYPVVWTLTLGEALEPYAPREFLRTGEMHVNWDRMWTPNERLAGRCPLLRLTNDSLSLLPCWTAKQ